MKNVWLAAAVWVGLTLVGCGGPVDEGQEAPVQESSSAGSVSQQDCVPLTCEELGLQCGRSRNNCGTFINCGGCPSPSDICTANQCIGPEEP